MKTIITYVVVFALAIAMAIVVRYYYLETYLVQSISMNKTLFDGDKLLIIRTKYVRSGDVLVFFHNQETYVKRLIGLPGDTIQINQRILYVNHKKKIERYINAGPNGNLAKRTDPTIMSYYGVNWTVENFGPYVVPRKGSKIMLDNKNFNIYKKLLDKELEPNFNIEDMMNQEYVFKNDYYFMIGDNRLFSEDSRMYGPLTKSDIIGRADYILFSKNNIWRGSFKKI